MCDSEYEYEPHGVFGTGQASGLTHVEGPDPQPLGLRAAFQRVTAEAKRQYPVWVPKRKA